MIKKINNNKKIFLDDYKSKMKSSFDFQRSPLVTQLHLHSCLYREDV